MNRSIITITYRREPYAILKQYRIFGILFLTISCPEYAHYMLEYFVDLELLTNKEITR